MALQTPSPDTSAHWALYLLAAYESRHPDTPCASATDLWTDTTHAQQAFCSKDAIASALSRLHDWGTPTPTSHACTYLVREDQSQHRETDYRLADFGKRYLRRLGTPADEVGDQTVTAPPTNLPAAIYNETGVGKGTDRPQLPAPQRKLPAIPHSTQKPALTSESTTIQLADSTDALQTDGEPVDISGVDFGEPATPADHDSGDSPIDFLFVDPEEDTPSHRRHVYVHSEDHGGMVPKCGLEQTTRPPETLAFVEAAAFEEAATACGRCLDGVSRTPLPADCDRDGERLPADRTAAQPALPSAETETDPDPLTVSVEPDWEWLAIALAEAGHSELARRAWTHDVSPSELYGDVLDALAQ